MEWVAAIGALGRIHNHLSRRNKPLTHMAPAPHCDSSILHAPNKCTCCDLYPEFQRFRIVARINFTGENNPEKAPCPSSFFRPLEAAERWGSNRAMDTPAVTLQKLRTVIEEAGDLRV